MNDRYLPVYLPQSQRSKLHLGSPKAGVAMIRFGSSGLAGLLSEPEQYRLELKAKIFTGKPLKT
jgi:hypothetical protein